MSEEKKPAPARPAATVVILRDGPDGIETFMVVRHHAIDFASGALVFPGGKVDAQDAGEAWDRLAPGAPFPIAREFLVAAARETFEEAGLLLARRRGEAGLVDHDHAQRIVANERERLIKGDATFAEILAREELEVATDLLVHFAHWITPMPVPKRFDTQFLLVAAPVAQLGIHDGSESVEGIWIRPQAALEEADAGKRTLVFATAMNLRKLAQHGSVAETVAATRAAPVVTVMPRMERTPEGQRKLYIPAEAGYGVTEVVHEMPSLPGH
ncbi:MAG: NUDIX domain-containing protein [Hyphomicrobiaceae bacterium]|nr:NUDIX domain-containing protein [Hyphomicrobiaceae bacterium]